MRKALLRTEDDRIQECIAEITTYIREPVFLSQVQPAIWEAQTAKGKTTGETAIEAMVNLQCAYLHDQHEQDITNNEPL